MEKPAVFREAIQMLRKYLVFPPNKPNQRNFFKFRFYSIFIICMTPSLIGIISYVWRVSTTDTVSLTPMLEGIQVVAELMAAGGTAILGVYHANEILEFFYHLGIHKFAEPDGLAETYKRHDKISNLIILFTRAVVIGRIFFNLSEKSFCQAKQTFNDERYLCGLLVPCWFPFKMNMLLKFWIVAGSYLILGFYLPIAAVGYFIVFGVSDLIVLRMQKMKRMLEELDFEGNEEMIKEQLLECIEYHFELWDLVKMMNDSLGFTHVCQYSLISGIIALLEYQLTMSFNITVCFQLFIWIVGEFVVCSAGQNIENEREAMAIALYLSPWHKLPINLRRTFTMFLGKMQMPLHFEARPMIHLNYELLMKVLKGSYTFLMFLKSV